MRIERWDPSDAVAARGCHEVWQAARASDDPAGSPKSGGIFRCWLAEGWENNPGETWFVPGELGIIAWYRLGLPDLENQDRASLYPFVHPAHRRGGIGTALLRHGARRAAANGRVTLEGVTLADSPGDAFARRAGAAPSLLEIRRVLDLDKVPAGTIASLREQAARVASGYSLITWAGPTPEEFLGQVASVYNAFADAPHGEGVQPEVWDAKRIRERADSLLYAGPARGYSVAARHDGCGEMAGITQVIVDPEHPDWGHQGLTAVSREHRGHRLGLLVKAAMLEWLADAEPKLRRIDTGNASSNQHMIAINAALGFQVAGASWQFYELPVSSVVP
jgi:GNAT superfamily N-acetyltransferase